MKKIIRNIAWYSYYLYDRVKCLPSKNSVKEIDNKLATLLANEIDEKKFEKVIIFATYEKELSDEYIKYFLPMVDHSLTVIINNTIKHEFGVESKDGSVIWVNRPNFGRDIASYKLGVRSVLRSQRNHIKDLTLINDSLYILKSKFFDFFTIEFSDDVLAHSYSTLPRPHARSYLIRLKPKVLDSLDAYLETIPFAKSRYNAVINGEIGMNKNVLLQYKIGLWAYSGIFKEISSREESRDLDVYSSAYISNKYMPKATKTLEKDIKEKVFIDNFLRDPYELSSTSSMFQPNVIKREVYEKGLASKEKVFSAIENSELPDSAKKELLKQILISKRHFGIKNRLKLAIGEI